MKAQNMAVMALFLCCPLAAYASPTGAEATGETAPAQMVTIPFAPPLDTPLYYECRTQWVSGGERLTLRVWRELRFLKRDGGWVAHMRILAQRTSGSAVQQAALQKQIGIFAGQSNEFGIDDRNGTVAVTVSDAQWEAATAPLRQWVADGALTPETDALVRSILQLPRAAQHALILGDVMDIVRFARSTLAVQPLPDGAWRVDLQQSGEGKTRFDIDSTTGLVRELQRHSQDGSYLEYHVMRVSPADMAAFGIALP